jgi:transitional endoplasmic reticulum ATPase
VLLTLLDGLRSRHGAVLAVAASNRPDALDPALRRPGRLEWEVPLALPSAGERAAALRASVAGAPLAADVRLDAVAAECSGYAAADLIALAREALLCAARRYAALGAASDAAAGGADEAADEEDAPLLRVCDLRKAVTRSRASVLRPSSSMMAAAEPLAWNSIGGAEEPKLRLKRAVEWPTTKAGAYRHFGIRPPRGVLLHGPPGCAKTSLAYRPCGSKHPIAQGSSRRAALLLGAHHRAAITGDGTIFEPCGQARSRRS